MYVGPLRPSCSLHGAQIESHSLEESRYMQSLVIFHKGLVRYVTQCKPL